MIIGLAGKKGSGKDTLGNFIIQNYNYKRYAFGDPVKDICKILFGFNHEQLHGNKKDVLDETLNLKPRECFQKIGTEFGREFFNQLFPKLSNNIWIDIFKRNFNNNNIVITDVRFQDEVDAIQQLGGKVFLIERNNSISDNHISEKINITYDHKILNIGTKEELFNIIKPFIT